MLNRSTGGVSTGTGVCTIGFLSSSGFSSIGKKESIFNLKTRLFVLRNETDVVPTLMSVIIR